ncbi:hypothetical protein QJQ45_010128 [Haematococcus lacustris]|nr:hypothetical protein QJQ45_010128 [Haematococcus lacustris]
MLGRGDAARNAGGLQSSQSAVFLTGASTGIGYAAAKLLASKGWRVYAGVRRAEDAARLQACSTLITPLIVDVTQHATVEAAVELIGREQGSLGLQALVNNAGVGGALAPLEFLAESAMREVLEVNLVGVVRVTQAFLPLLRRGKAKGRIVNIGSIAGTVAFPLFGAYAMSKFGLEATSDMLRWELAPQGIKIKEITQAGSQTRVQASDVAAVIHTALTSPHPKARYHLPFDAWILMLLRRLLPDWLFDPIMQAMMAGARRGYVKMK